MSNSSRIPYPWQQPYWAKLLHWQQQGRLPHALLFTGPSGIGKHHLAETFAHYLLCEKPQSDLPCGQCKSCLLNQAQTHPDYARIAPEEAGRAIKVDQIRGLTEFLSQTSQQGAMKVIVLDGADLLNTNAANALLKGLEEPAKNTLLILVSGQPGKIMATIRSRCQIMQLPLPVEEQVLPWLKPLVGEDVCDELLDATRGAPLAALTMYEGEGLEHRKQFIDALLDLATGSHSVVEVAKKWQDKNLEQLLLWLQQWLSSGIKRQVVGRSYTVTGAKPLIDALALVPQQVVYRYFDKIGEARRQLNSGANPNKQLLLEDLLLDWQAVNRAAARR